MQRYIDDCIGNTPLLEVFRSGSTQILAKLEYLNPAGSVKDRAVKFMLDDAAERGKLKKGATVIEPTSGNTGIALAALCAAKGIRAVVVMPDGFSHERRKIITAYGAELVLTDGAEGMRGAIKIAEALQKETPNAFILGQFKNPANPLAHYKTTAPEIWAGTGGRADIFVAGVGTGGTLTGVGRYLKEKNPAIKVIAVEPASSPVLSGGQAGAHKIEGIGAGFIPRTLDLNIMDEVITVSGGAAVSAAGELAAKGVFAGVSSGAAFAAAKILAARKENAGKIIVTVFPDGGGRYLSVSSL